MKLLLNTVFTRNLAMARFNFETLFYSATIWGWLDFEGSVYMLYLTMSYRTLQRSKNRLVLLSVDRGSLLLTVACLWVLRCLQNHLCGRARTYLHNKYFKFDWAFTTLCHFEGSIYWYPSTEKCGVILRAATVWGAVRFQGNTLSFLWKQLKIYCTMSRWLNSLYPNQHTLVWDPVSYLFCYSQLQKLL